MAQEGEKADYSSDDEKNKRTQTRKGRGAATAKTATAPAPGTAPKTGNAQGSKIVNQASTFKDFLLKEELMRAINEAGFEKPSEVQQDGIFYILYGEDLLCQAKSGTGKTAVFVLGILQNIKVDADPF